MSMYNFATKVLFLIEENGQNAHSEMISKR